MGHGILRIQLLSSCPPWFPQQSGKSWDGLELENPGNLLKIFSFMDNLNFKLNLSYFSDLSFSVLTNVGTSVRHSVNGYIATIYVSPTSPQDCRISRAKSSQSQTPREHLVKGVRHWDLTQQNFGITENEELNGGSLPLTHDFLIYQNIKENLEVGAFTFYCTFSVAV